jgi:hypothetical protein
MFHDNGPGTAPTRLRLRLLRTLARLMTLVALCALACAAARSQLMAPPPPRLVYVAPRAVPISTAVPARVAGLDDRIIHPAPEGLDARIIHRAPEGIDEGIVAAPERLSRPPGTIAPRGLRVVPVPGLVPVPPYRRLPPVFPRRPWPPR